MFDQLITTCASWDWVSPLIAMWRSWRAGPSVALFVRPSTLSAWELKNFLQGRGIEVWGVMVLGGLVHLCVREADASRAEYLLAWAGAPVVTVDEHSIGWDDRETHTAPEWARE